MASITDCGFCAVAALSRYTSGFPWIFCFRTGKSSRIFSTSKPVGTTLVSVLMEFLKQDSFERIPQGLHLDTIDDVLRERVGQQAARLVFADASRPQVEQRLRIQLSDGGAVGAVVRTRAGPNEIECEEKFALRANWACRVAIWKASRDSRWIL